MFIPRSLLTSGLLICIISQINAQDNDELQGRSILGNIIRLGGDLNNGIGSAADSLVLGTRKVVRDSIQNAFGGLLNTNTANGQNPTTPGLVANNVLVEDNVPQNTAGSVYLVYNDKNHNKQTIDLQSYFNNGGNVDLNNQNQPNNQAPETTSSNIGQTAENNVQTGASGNKPNNNSHLGTKNPGGGSTTNNNVQPAPANGQSVPSGSVLTSTVRPTDKPSQSSSSLPTNESTSTQNLELIGNGSIEKQLKEMMEAIKDLSLKLDTKQDKEDPKKKGTKGNNESTALSAPADVKKDDLPQCKEGKEKVMSLQKIWDEIETNESIMKEPLSKRIQLGTKMQTKDLGNSGLTDKPSITLQDVLEKAHIVEGEDEGRKATKLQPLSWKVSVCKSDIGADSASLDTLLEKIVRFDTATDKSDFKLKDILKRTSTFSKDPKKSDSKTLTEILDLAAAVMDPETGDLNLKGTLLDIFKKISVPTSTLEGDKEKFSEAGKCKDNDVIKGLEKVDLKEVMKNIVLTATLSGKLMDLFDKVQYKDEDLDLTNIKNNVYFMDVITGKENVTLKDVLQWKTSYCTDGIATGKSLENILYRDVTLNSQIRNEANHLDRVLKEITVRPKNKKIDFAPLDQVLKWKVTLKDKSSPGKPIFEEVVNELLKKLLVPDVAFK